MSHMKINVLSSMIKLDFDLNPLLKNGSRAPDCRLRNHKKTVYGEA